MTAGGTPLARGRAEEGLGGGARGDDGGGGTLACTWGPSDGHPVPGRDEACTLEALWGTGSRWHWRTEVCTWGHGVILYSPNTEYSVPGSVIEAGAAARTSERGFLPQDRTVSGPVISSNGKAVPSGCDAFSEVE